jgi:hypothetical protein
VVTPQWGLGCTGQRPEGREHRVVHTKTPLREAGITASLVLSTR